MTSPAREGVALITGAASRIGAVYAHRLAQRGPDLILVARDARKLDAFAARLEAATGCRVTVLEADLSAKPGRTKVEEVLPNDPDITVLVNAAGVGSAASILEADGAVMEATIDLNVTALTCLAYAAGPAFAARRQGTIINVASVVGIAVEALHGVYSASKAYALSFGQLLQTELGERGVRVQTVLPGSAASDLWTIVGYPPAKAAEILLPAETVVDAALAGLDAGEPVTFPGLYEADPRSGGQRDRAVFTRAARPARSTPQRSAA
jgi:short-subunit dehydrogenase